LRLRLEPSSYFATLRDFLRRSEFNEPSICRRAGVVGLNDFLSDDRLRITPSGELDGLGALVRLFLVGEPLGVEALESVIPAGALEAMKALGLLIQDPADYPPPLATLPNGGRGPGVGRAAIMWASVALYPVGRLFIVSDRWITPQGEVSAPPEDFVFPALTANTAQFIATLPWDACENFLELCSGTGVAAMAAAGRADHAWAVDITQRSTQMAEFNRLLNRIQNVTPIQGDLYECLGDLTFDRIVAHPPYMPVLNPTQAFYDGGVDGEQVTRRIVMGLRRRLRPGGRFYCLAQGSDRDGAPFELRVRAWLGEVEEEFDVLLIVRATQAPADAAMQYAVKSKGGGLAANQMRKALGDLHIQRMVYGWMVIQRREEARPVFTVRRSIGSHSGKDEIAWLLKWEAAAAKPGFIDLLAETRPVTVPSLKFHTIHRMKEGDLLPEEFSLQTEYPFSVDLRVQPWMGFLLPQCDGKLTVGQLLEFCKQHSFIRSETPLAEFAKLLMVFIANGFLEVEGFELPKNARQSRGPALLGTEPV
jgi:methylase of polypeptide subunit release factors